MKTAILKSSRTWWFSSERFFYVLADLFADSFHKNSITPNQVTCFGALLAVLSFIALMTSNMLLFFVLCWSRSFCDALDGHLARKFSMASKFGACLDLCCDIVFGGLLLIWGIWRSTNKSNAALLASVFALLFWCQQQFQNADLGQNAFVEDLSASQFLGLVLMDNSTYIVTAGVLFWSLVQADKY